MTITLMKLKGITFIVICIKEKLFFCTWKLDKIKWKNHKTCCFSSKQRTFKSLLLTLYAWLFHNDRLYLNRIQLYHMCWTAERVQTLVFVRNSSHRFHLYFNSTQFSFGVGTFHSRLLQKKPIEWELVLINIFSIASFTAARKTNQTVFKKKDFSKIEILIEPPFFCCANKTLLSDF